MTMGSKVNLEIEFWCNKVYNNLSSVSLMKMTKVLKFIYFIQTLYLIAAFFWESMLLVCGLPLFHSNE